MVLTTNPGQTPEAAARPARRVAGSKPSVMGRLLLAADELRAAGRQVIDLAAGAPLLPPPQDLLNAGCEAILGGRNNYGDANGVGQLCLAQARLLHRRYGLSYGRSEITVTAGASAALQATLLALCNPGDGVAMFEPFYEGFLPLIHLAGGRPKFVRLHEPNWQFNERELSRALSGRTRFLLLNTPHNPCGRVFSRDELEVVANVCRRRGIVVIADETYEHYVFEGAKHVTIAELPGMKELSVLIHSASKVFNVPGWRIGTVAASEALTKPIRQVNAMTLGAPIPLQHALATHIEKHDYDAFAAGLVKPYAPLMVSLCDAVNAAGFTAVRPQGTLSMMAGAGKWRSNVNTSEELSNLLLDRFSILTVPGSAFYHKQPAEPSIRFSFARDSKTIDQAVASLSRAA